jgi:cytochrome c biogenesis protein CcmG, thiol:disulfide interchange protein DsbE
MITRRLCCLLLALSLPLPGCPPGPDRRDDPPPSGAPARALRLTLPRLGGGTLSLESLRGRPVLITLFTTWCLRCQAEAPLFVRTHERYRGRGLAVVGVAVDLKASSMIQAYVDFVSFRFDVLYARPDHLDLVGAIGPTPQVPRTVLLDASGKVVLDQMGQTDFTALEIALERILRSR